MAPEPPIDFSYLRESLETDSTLRETIRDAVRATEREERKCRAVLDRVHSVAKGDAMILLSTLDPLLPPLRQAISNLADLIPPSQFYRYNDSFSRTLQSASLVIVFRKFLETEELAGKEEVETALGILPEWRDHFFLSTEEYLHSLISLLEELSRLSMNRATLGDFEAPVHYASFAKEMSSGFSLLNLKNDNLRKRFDGIKYQVKRLEEVVYDLSLRGLLSTSPEGTNNGDTKGPTKRARPNDDEVQL